MARSRAPISAILERATLNGGYQLHAVNTLRLAFDIPLKDLISVDTTFYASHKFDPPLERPPEFIDAVQAMIDQWLEDDSTRAS